MGFDIPTRDEFLDELGPYLTDVDPETVGNALALYGFDNGLDASSAPTPVSREARRQVMEQLGQWATEALDAGELRPTGDDENPVDPGGDNQREYPDLAALAAESWSDAA